MSDSPIKENYLLLGDAVSIHKGTINPANFSEESFQYFSIPSFDSLGGAENAKGSHIQSNKILLEGDCVLISKLNPRIPRVCKATISSSVRAICSTEFIPLVASNDHTDIEYLFHYLKSPGFQQRFQSAAGGSTNSHSRVTPREILDWEFYRPPLPEQKKIAEILSGIDSTIRAAESKLQKLITARSKVSEDLLAKSNAEVIKIPLCDCIELVRGYAFKSEDYKEQGGIRILRVTNIREDGKIDLANNCVRISEDLADNYNRFQVRENDLLLVMVGATTGKLGVVSKAEVPSLLNQNIWCLRTSSPRRIVQEYLHCSMPRVVSRHLEKQQGSARDFLTQKEFFKEEIEVPNLRIQGEIVQAMGQIDKCINATKSFRERLLLLKSGLSSDLLSGRKRVSV